MINVSIVVPAYNRANIIPKTLDSFIAQSYKYWECLVVDDNSSDNTKDVIEYYCKKDSRIKYLKNTRKKGAQGARNTGIVAAKSEWICIFDSDDYMYPDYMKELTNLICDDVDVVTCFSRVVDVNKGDTGRRFDYDCEGNIHSGLITSTCYVTFQQAIIRKTKLEEIGLLDECCPAMQEWDTHLRLSKISIYTTVHHILVDYFVGGKGTISSSKKREINGRIYVYSKHIDEFRMIPSSLCGYGSYVFDYINTNSSGYFKWKSIMRLAIVDKRLVQIAFNKFMRPKLSRIKHLIMSFPQK